MLVAGKTKVVWKTEDPHVVRIMSKNDVTAFDDKSKTIELAGKGAAATATTCNMFEALEAAGLPTSYVGRTDDPVCFLARACDMVPLECIARRLVVGASSLRRRRPDLPEGDFRFPRLWTEYSLKTTGGALEVGGKTIVEGLDPLQGEEDPYIADIYSPTWVLHRKKPRWDPDVSLNRDVWAKDVIVTIDPREIDALLRRATLVIEAYWASLGFEFVDIKIEFGILDGNLVIADVVDADSWRLRKREADGEYREYSKQAFRDMIKAGSLDPSALIAMYDEVTELTTRLRVPQQAVVLWRGSDKDGLPEIPVGPLGLKEEQHKTDLPGLMFEDVVISGHKQTRRALAKLAELEGKYPDGIVFIAKVGLSNGLGPILAAHTSWPTISLPAGGAAAPHDVWSSLDMPSGVPTATTLGDGNAVGLALRILAVNNPALAGQIRYVVEEMDVVD